MTGILYALNVGTLAVWTTVAGAGIFSLVGGPVGPPARPALTVTMDQNTGEGPLVDLMPESGSPEPGPSEEVASEEAPEPVPTEIEAPPEVPVTELAPPPELPEMPDLPPPPVVKPAAAAVVTSNRPKEQPAVKSTVSKGTGRPTSQPQPGNGSGSGNGKGTGTGQGTAPGNGKAGGDGARLAKGNIPKPTYPQACRDAGQAGTVTVLFTVDASGKVISARVTKPCPFAPLNEAALNAVKRGTFPAGGGVASATKPITFNLKD
ncbi:MAG: hypothetical protein JWO82_348 [Akkermansiaceae bacterium]|nr:hypothetical protein [Akkermansiaceae bacterium]